MNADYIINRGDGYLLEGFVAWSEATRRWMEENDQQVELTENVFRPEGWAKLFGIDVAEFKCRDRGQRPAKPCNELPELPKEVSTERAAAILGVSNDTVLKLKVSGMLEYRNTAPPTSSRPVFRFSLASVLAVRTGYSRDAPDARSPLLTAQGRRTRQTEQAKFKHFRYDD